MTHADLLLLASSNTDSHLVTLYAREARELVSAHERLLEERDEALAAIPDGWEVDLAERRTQERDAALQRASSAESELVRMSERTEAMRGRVEAVSRRVWQARAVNWNCGGPANRTPARSDAPEGSWVCWPEWERTMLGHLDAASEMADAALRSLVSDETNDEEKTR